MRGEEASFTPASVMSTSFNTSEGYTEGYTMEETGRRTSNGSPLYLIRTQRPILGGDPSHMVSAFISSLRGQHHGAFFTKDALHTGQLEDVFAAVRLACQEGYKWLWNFRETSQTLLNADQSIMRDLYNQAPPCNRAVVRRVASGQFTNHIGVGIFTRDGGFVLSPGILCTAANRWWLAGRAHNVQGSWILIAPQDDL